MTGRTHRVYAMEFVFIIAIVLYATGLMEHNYYISLFIMVVVAPLGAKFPDYDVDPEYLPVKTIPAKTINFIIRHTGGKHRSWHTHSVEAFTIVCALAVYVSYILKPNEYLTASDQDIFSLVAMAFMSGWLSHLFADMLNYKGITLFGKRIALVPKRIGKMKFNTDGEWEDFNYYVVDKANKILGFAALLFPMILQLL